MPDRNRIYHGVCIGILMLDTRFQRFNGDIGNARTWPFPVQYRIVRDATPNRVTRPEGPDMLDAFKAAADEMIDAGVDGITTTCGFLALYQRELAEHCSVPVATSALLQVPMVARILPKGKRPAILTFSAESLTSRHLEAVGADTATPIYGMPPGSEFQRAIREGRCVRAVCHIAARGARDRRAQPFGPSAASARSFSSARTSRPIREISPA